MKNSPPDGVIQIVIDDVSKLDWNKNFRNSPEVIVKGIAWKGSVYQEKDIRVGLTCLHDQSAQWSIDVDAEFTLVHPDNSENITVEKSRSFKRSEMLTTILMDEAGLANSDKKFVNNDKITVNIHLWISKMRGIRIAPQIDFTDPNEPYHNLTLIIGGEKLYVSKEILAAWSPVFKAMFYGDFAEKNKNEIELKGVIRKQFIELLQMIYPINRSITIGSISILLKLADRFEIQCVMERAESFLIAHDQLPIDLKLSEADVYRLSTLKEHCLSQLVTTDDVKTVEDSARYCALSDGMKAAIRERKAEIERESERESATGN